MRKKSQKHRTSKEELQSKSSPKSSKTLPKVTFQRENLFEKGFEEIRSLLKTSTKRELFYELDHFQDRYWSSETQKLQQTPILHLNNPEHPLPQTRRDFLSHGIYGASLAMSAPLILPSTSLAADCTNAGAGAATNLPVVVIDGSGGASYAGDNFIVGAANDPYNFLDDYTRMGVPNAQNPGTVGVETPFGPNTMPFHPQSRILQGIMETTSAATRSNTDGTLVCVETDDDTGNNRLNVSQALAQAGNGG